MLPKRALSLTGLLLAPMVSWGFSYETPSITPEVGSGFEEKPGWAADSFAVAAANPLATDAGYQVLKAGGNAIDAAVAVQMVLTLVEPQSSGIGGGAFLMHFDGADVQAYDGRETAPAAVTGELFMEDGEPLPFMEAVASGLSVGVPGTLRMLEQAHAEHGQLAWQELFTPAITLAEEGFAVSQRLHTSLANDEYLRENDLAQAFYYSADGEPLEVGTTLKNPALAAILRRIAEEGSAAFYEGEVAEDLVEQVQSHPVRPGKISLDDISGYQSLEREPLCTPWQQWEVCGFPPPSSGHLTIMQILGMLDQQPLLEAPLENGVTSSGWLHQFLEASRLAFADRGRYIADPDFVEAPGGDWSLMLAPDYLGKRSELIGEESMGESAEPGNPGELTVSFASQPEQPEYGTSHISIVDADGNAIAMTTTIEQAFGSRILADGGTDLPGGYLLNNELTDFSFAPEVDGQPVANRVEPGKRPRSSMSPTLVFDQETGALVASLGSPGGAAIIHYTARTLAAMRDWGLNAQEALSLPHAITLGGDVYLEEGRFPEEIIESLRERGHSVSERELTSGLQAIRRLEDGTLFGGADPRREGVVMGE
ncbi:MAG: gamma-glutamyltransferase [Pseudomonadota bacterium]|jgi:gamma-glutamyltranspeptidase/glutathione hydrolase|uniref:gamma-glutamyltransferase n=1 Tax=Halomonas sp. 15WGF TaxID=2570357 RepID=UPI0010BE39A1|nr:gamma-glutamyltransferase [Halomonas sp. 15WGF]MEC9020720.1 gamma-glutamyltransferase [Pseudomonadota bacterium]MED5557978.1 gamma-glutamyltransferase [Pseudomonadota bacterium]TKJ11565.1 gamma-glutamyltransferase [Halomonas sp. 15WGF]|tara:strand:- start:3448 stop:5235 length:1788 start_codon:yes stop_codon:yes gene_type:complete